MLTYGPPRERDSVIFSSKKVTSNIPPRIDKENKTITVSISDMIRLLKNKEDADSLIRELEVFL